MFQNKNSDEMLGIIFSTGAAFVFIGAILYIPILSRFMPEKITAETPADVMVTMAGSILIFFLGLMGQCECDD